jgi:hypothetical protein
MPTNRLFIGISALFMEHFPMKWAIFVIVVQTARSKIPKKFPLCLVCLQKKLYLCRKFLYGYQIHS